MKLQRWHADWNMCYPRPIFYLIVGGQGKSALEGLLFIDYPPSFLLKKQNNWTQTQILWRLPEGEGVGGGWKR